jgi:hypothetical protein
MMDWTINIAADRHLLFINSEEKIRGSVEASGPSSVKFTV